MNLLRVIDEPHLLHKTSTFPFIIPLPPSTSRCLRRSKCDSMCKSLAFDKYQLDQKRYKTFIFSYMCYIYCNEGYIQRPRGAPTTAPSTKASVAHTGGCCVRSTRGSDSHGPFCLPQVPSYSFVCPAEQLLHCCVPDRHPPPSWDLVVLYSHCQPCLRLDV